MTSLHNTNQRSRGTDFMSAHHVLNRKRIKDVFTQVATKKEVLSNATVEWIKNIQLHNGNEEVLHSLFAHLFTLEEKCKMVEAELLVAKRKAYFCGLTNLLNKNFFLEFVSLWTEKQAEKQEEKQEEKREEKSEEDLSTYLFSFDLNKFKEINDTHGHFVGDEALMEVAKRLSRIIRSKDMESFNFQELASDNFVARIGGDEFIGKIELSSDEDAEKLKERIQKTMKLPFETSAGHLIVGVSVGYQRIDTDVNFEELLKNLDKKMYEDKREAS